MGEVGDDTGGLKREFFRLHIRDIPDSCWLCATQQCNFAGENATIFLVFQFFCFWLQNDVYRQLGELVAASVAQGGSAVHLFNNSVYKYMWK